jgi:aryl sulfotransferase
VNGQSVEWPRKTRELQNHHFDSTKWNGFSFRDDDIIIATYAKSGTTWLQQIVAQLLFDGAEGLDVAAMSPWIDLRVPPRDGTVAMVEAQEHRRFLKTHLPVDALVFSQRARYLYIARDGRDVVWSMHNHHMKANDRWYALLNDSPGLVGPPIERPTESVRQYFRDWLERDGHPWWPYWENVRSWWAIRELPNVTLLHFNDLKADLPGEIRKLAALLEVSIDESRWTAIVEHCSFDYMKRHGDELAPLGGVLWEGGARDFIHRGDNGRWHDVLDAEEIAAYERRAVDELGDDCARWLATGDQEPDGNSA